RVAEHALPRHRRVELRDLELERLQPFHVADECSDRLVNGRRGVLVEQGLEPVRAVALAFPAQDLLGDACPPRLDRPPHGDRDIGEERAELVHRRRGRRTHTRPPPPNRGRRRSGGGGRGPGPKHPLRPLAADRAVVPGLLGHPPVPPPPPLPHVAHRRAPDRPPHPPPAAPPPPPGFPPQAR